jgi:hypothetical protein
LSESTSCHLSIQIRRDGFSFALLNLDNQKYMGLEYYDIQNDNTPSDLAQKVDQIIAKQKLLQQGFASTSIAIADTLNTLIPEAIYSESNRKEILQFNHPTLQNEKESRDWLPSIEAFNSYVISEALERCFKKTFQGLFTNMTAAYLSKALFNNSNCKKKKKYTYQFKTITLN